MASSRPEIVNEGSRRRRALRLSPLQRALLRMVGGRARRSRRDRVVSRLRAEGAVPREIDVGLRALLLNGCLRQPDDAPAMLEITERGAQALASGAGRPSAA